MLGFRYVFPGLGQAKKQELIDLAGNNNLKVTQSVTKHLDFLCGGENAGPKKIEKAEAQGVQFLTEGQFLNFIDTGEVPGG